MSENKPVRTTPPESNINDDLVLALAHMVRAMIPLAQRIVSDEFSPEERRKLRDLAGGDGVFRLSNLLNRLCSEGARNQFQKKEGTLQRPRL